MYISLRRELHTHVECYANTTLTSPLGAGKETTVPILPINFWEEATQGKEQLRTRASRLQCFFN